MTKKIKYSAVITLILCSTAIFLAGAGVASEPRDYETIDKFPLIKPDYTDITIPRT